MIQINWGRHLQKTLQNFDNARDSIERLREEYPESKNFHKVLERAIEWYETDNLNAYIFFHKAFPVSKKDPTEFYDSLCGFLVNTLLDDSCFELVWTEYDGDTGKDIIAPKKAWDKSLTVSVSVMWSHDDSPNYSIDAGLMLKAMEYLDEKDRLSEELDRKLEEPFKR